MGIKSIRRGQLVTPFGVGALSVTNDGVSLVTAGLDHWFDSDSEKIDLAEFKIKEPRLQKSLQVNHFRLPPDFRTSHNQFQKKGEKNFYLEVPAFRFPTYHICPSCQYLQKSYLNTQQKMYCDRCSQDGGKKYRKNVLLNQVQFIVICKKGHMADFPWREWVHKGVHGCIKNLKLVASSSGALLDSTVKCDCGEQRSMSRTMQYVDSDSTGESTRLSVEMNENKTVALCQGGQPWLGLEKVDAPQCTEHFRASFRNAANLYYSTLKTSIYIPSISVDNTEQIQKMLEEKFSHVKKFMGNGNYKLVHLREVDIDGLLSDFSDEEISRAIDAMDGNQLLATPTKTLIDDELTFRYEEYKTLENSVVTEELMTRAQSLEEYSDYIQEYFENIVLVNKLTETRVLAGFGRLVPMSSADVTSSKAMMWGDAPEPFSSSSWLPASVVKGEGIFLEFNRDKLDHWLNNQEITKRIEPLIERMTTANQRRNFPSQEISPEFVLIHTFAHLMINRLSFECGYSASALRERLYVSNSKETRMYGLLIYTASGDSEGSLGGLVRMGSKERFENIVRHAVRDSSWCGNDPVCMEHGSPSLSGQGPDGSNLASCHACSLVSETSCEKFNVTLDRAMVSGDHDKLDGYFEVFR